MFDTHCHLFSEPLKSNCEAVLERAAALGVQRILIPSVSRETIVGLLCGERPKRVRVHHAYGIHPWWAGEGVDIPWLAGCLEKGRASAVGEIGLDWKTGPARDVQTGVFQSQLQLAAELELPVILHCRGAFFDMLEILKDYPVTGVVHAWSRGPVLMERFLEAGMFISFGGAVTRPGANRAAEIAKIVPANRYVIETDAPSLGLHGVPAGESEPAHVAMVLSAMAALREESPEATASCAMSNSLELFKES